MVSLLLDKRTLYHVDLRSKVVGQIRHPVQECKKKRTGSRLIHCGDRHMYDSRLLFGLTFDVRRQATAG